MEEANAAVMWNARAAEALLTRGLLRYRQGDAAGGQADLDMAMSAKPQLKARIERLLPQVETSTVTAVLYPIAKSTDGTVAKASSTPSKTAKKSSTPKAPSDSTKKSGTVSIPKTAQKYFDDGLAAYEKGEYEQANTAFKRAITLFPRYAEAYLYRGLINLRQGEDQEAERLLAECVRLQPDLQDKVDAERAKIEKQ